MRRTFGITYKILLHMFAVIGVVMVGGFFAIRFHITDVSGAVDANSEKYAEVLGVATDAPANPSESQLSLDSLSAQIDQLAKTKQLRQQNLCAVGAIGVLAPVNAKNILDSYRQTNSDVLVSKMVFAADLRWQEAGNNSAIDTCLQNLESTKNVDYDHLEAKYQNASGQNIFPWMNDEEWKTIGDAIVKDKAKIDQASAIAGIEPRLVVASAIVEQVRLFHSQRELFKKFFEPLKILGNSNKISLGIMGVKEKTAIDAEEHLKDPASPYYLGKEMESALNFSSDDTTSERFARLTNEKDHYYSYLYGAIYMKEMMSQWKKAGFNISYRPEIVGTLFNVGFPQSKPNADPKVGGSEITVGDAKYSFGSLSYEFYYSGELLDAFPYVVN